MLANFAVFLGLLLNLTFAHATPWVGPSPVAEEHDPQIYQLGSEWGKKQVTLSSIEQESKIFQRAAKATFQLSTGGTGFYLGKFNRLHVVATNHHVCSMGAVCLNGHASFTILKKSYRLAKFLGTMESVDLTLLAIEVPSVDEALLLPLAQNFAFHHVITQGEPLLTLGYGIAGNPSEKLVANQDSDCVVVSKTGEYQELADPDTISPADYRAWSFANGCDLSHGDSGSAMINRNTGEIVGIIWTGRTPKPLAIQNSIYLQSLITNPTAEVWSDLSYAVPALKMPEAILQYLAKYDWIDAETRAVLKKLIQKPSFSD